ncbi:hypothetical protein LMG9964_05860 [Paraburkholderia phenoliruptrix]|uniref:Hpt domain-containing protein n=3 Tax=Paraburkholderia phenoliruptrix TaxID=252970 RepID=K0DS10_9BURK|nr:Hpt domain-containing protein [Paraburkholderia phenoliruptrix BR3459a]CAB4052174.1 hypothetical protein LMG9964_05860 [Paraburkholderia phenoliruptrix]
MTGGGVHSMKAATFCPDSYFVNARARDLVGDDERAVRRLLELIAETNRSTLASLHQSFEAGRWGELASAAHRMAGSARMLGHDELLAVLSDLEAAARTQDRERATAHMPLIAEALARLGKSIEEALKDSTGAGQ